METTPYQRLELFWSSKSIKNASAFAESVGIKPATISAIKQRGSRPSSAVMLAIQQAYPDINPDYVLWGTGSMLRDGRSLAPFVPGGEVNKQGATVLQPGALGKALPLGNMEDMDAQHRPADAPAPAASNAKEFIAGLLREIDGHKVEKDNLRNQLDKVYRALEESQRSNRVCQEQLSLLLGKSSGNQYAPGTFAPVMHVSPAEQIDEAQALEEGCVVRPIFTAPARQRRMHKVVSEHAA